MLCLVVSYCAVVQLQRLPSGIVQIFEYNGSAIVAMAGKECFAIGSDLRFGVQFQTLATDYKKVYKVGPGCRSIRSKPVALHREASGPAGAFAGGMHIVQVPCTQRCAACVTERMGPPLCRCTTSSSWAWRASARTHRHCEEPDTFPFRCRAAFRTMPSPGGALSAP